MHAEFGPSVQAKPGWGTIPKPSQRTPTTETMRSKQRRLYAFISTLFGLLVGLFVGLFVCLFVCLLLDSKFGSFGRINFGGLWSWF
jgi:hypothetical protein